MNYSSSTFFGRALTKNLRQLKSFGLDENQNKISLSLDARCKENCSFLHPIDETKLKICEEECFEKHRDVFRLKNASNRVLSISIFMLFFIIVFSIYNYYSTTYGRK